MARDGRCEMYQCEVVCGVPAVFRVRAAGAGAQIDEAVATSATGIISSHCSEDNFMEEEQRRAFAGERNG
jgi:hypothetical protein